MRYDLPTLICLPAFEAAARLESFTKAARELSRTQAAISFQVRNLEKSLSVKLFLRRHQSLELTDEGRALLSTVQSAFSSLAAEKARITGNKSRDTVSISIPVSFSGKWLVPRLHRLHKTAPRVNLQIDANDTLIDMKGGNVQLAIRYCDVPPEGYHVQRLINDVVFPVCSPQLAAIKERKLPLNNLKNLTLLTDQMADFTWSEWLEKVGAPADIETSKIRFSHTGNAIDAAIAGQGVAIGRLALVADDLINGRLIRPFHELGYSSYAYYILRSPESLENPDAVTVTEWLLAEAAETASFLDLAPDA